MLDYPVTHLLSSINLTMTLNPVQVFNGLIIYILMLIMLKCICFDKILMMMLYVDHSRIEDMLNVGIFCSPKLQGYTTQ